ncbi:MAG TPA: hypothetical protein VGG64_00560 [Pirellulales bacterium]
MENHSIVYLRGDFEMMMFNPTSEKSAAAPRSAALRLGVWALTLGTVLTSAGCGQSAPPRVPVFPVQGKVSVNGKPAAGALVILHPKGDPSKPSARAAVKPDGTFEATTYAPADGAAEGDYVVTVEWYKAVPKNDDYVVGPNLVPDKYSKPQTSNIEVRVAAQPNELPPITLKR